MRNYLGKVIKCTLAVTHNHELHHYCMIFIPEEEESLVKLRGLQGISKSELTTILLDILKIRDYMNKKCKGGRKFVKLSHNAKSTLEKGK